MLRHDQTPVGPIGRVLVVTDSLAFPRDDPELVRYEETYIAILKGWFPRIDFFHHGKGGATLVDLYKHTAYYHHTLRPDLVLIHAGIVDCAPRALTVLEQQIVSRLPMLGPPLTALVKRHSATLRRIRKMTYTALPDFVAAMDAFHAVFAEICWIQILPAPAAYETKLQGIGRSIERYNASLRGRPHVETAGFGAADVMSDHYHLNRAGHLKMAGLIAEKLERAIATVRLAESASPVATVETSPAPAEELR